MYRAGIDAGVREAEARLAAAQETHRAIQADVDLAIRTVGLELQTVVEQIALYENALLPQAEQALRSTEEAYSTGTTGVLDLLDSDEVLLEVRLGLARLETDYMKALAAMERAIGVPFPLTATQQTEHLFQGRRDRSAASLSTASGRPRIRYANSPSGEAPLTAVKQTEHLFQGREP